MNYKIRPGVVRTAVCGEQLLVATRQARGKCPYVQMLNSTGLFYWELLEKGLDYDAMLQEALAYYAADRETLAFGLTNFLEMLQKRGYLITEDDA